MKSLKQELQHTFNNTDPKKISQKVKQNKELYEYVHTSDARDITLSQKIFNILNPDNETCNHGNNRNFKSLSYGYVFCGRASVCLCAKETVSKKVSLSKNKYSIDKKKSINSKRVATNVSKYGIKNTGQLDKSINNHRQFYQDSSKVNEVTQSIKNTKQIRYGNQNYNNITKMKETYKQKSDEYWASRYSNENLLILRDKEKLKEFSKNKSIEEIATGLEVHAQTVYRYLNDHKLRSKYRSFEETQVVNFLEENGINNLVLNSRKIIDKEIDIFVPDKKIAIEYNGVYWHHEDLSHIDKNYHYEKFRQCEEQGIQLITIFSNLWNSKRDIVKQSLINKLGICNNSVYARKCSITRITSLQTKTLLNSSHIQGYVPAPINYGLFFENDLVAVMTFSNSRVGIGNSKNNHYELVRYASNTRVVGGASKLLTRFMSDYNPEKIISYSNNEWSDGRTYSSIGFTLDRNIPPSYWYLKPREEILMHRYNFAKHKLIEKGWDASLTEKEITKQMGLLKVWDCGKKRWIYEK